MPAILPLYVAPWHLKHVRTHDHPHRGKQFCKRSILEAIAAVPMLTFVTERGHAITLDQVQGKPVKAIEIRYNGGRDKLVLPLVELFPAVPAEPIPTPRVESFTCRL